MLQLATRALGARVTLCEVDAGGAEFIPTANTSTALPRWSMYSYAANRPVEDRFCVRGPGTAAAPTMWAVFDGHGGWQVAEYASQHLCSNIEAELRASSASAVPLCSSAGTAETQQLSASSCSSPFVSSIAVTSLAAAPTGVLKSDLTNDTNANANAGTTGCRQKLTNAEHHCLQIEVD